MKKIFYPFLSKAKWVIDPEADFLWRLIKW